MLELLDFDLRLFQFRAWFLVFLPLSAPVLKASLAQLTTKLSFIT
ncbi:MAG: hypothetical protein ACERKO_06845 [Acetanaerobacterium sp.]